MSNNQDWPARLADQLEIRRPEGLITIASGISPSGPIHMGNLREVMTGAFVAEELTGRGRQVRHILSWDDYDRFRKVPEGIAGVDETWQACIGMPLSEVPAPVGSPAESWADHFRAPFQQAFEVLGVQVEEISQSKAYKSGRYHEDIVEALNHREELGEILARHQTKGDAYIPPRAYYPFRPYCNSCGRDTTRVRTWNSEEEYLGYECSCGNFGGDSLRNIAGKLVWKVDWPMRWRYERVDFEPAGRDHMSPGSSWTVGHELMQVFEAEGPLGQAYSFVGIDGRAKMASSKGGAPTPSELLPLMGTAVMRWLYVRPRPEQAFSIDIMNLSRLMDEWDALQRRVQAGTAHEVELAHWERSTRQAVADVALSTVKYSTWVSFADMTESNIPFMVALAEADNALSVQDMLRAQQAAAWVNGYMPLEERTHFLTDFRSDYFESLPEEQQNAIRTLAEGLGDHWQELTRWGFGVPKLFFGYDLDERRLSHEANEFQREYFRHVYQLLVGEEKGPRLPSLMQCLGLPRTVHLLTGISEGENHG